MIVLMQVQTQTMNLLKKNYQLLNYINERSPESNIYLCSLCPRVDTLVSGINEVIKRLCHDHQGTYIDVHKAFYNKRGQLKVLFYQSSDNIHLSTSGTKELLGAINAHTDIVDNFKTCALNGGPPQYKIYQSGRKRHRPNNYSNDNYTERCFKCGLTNHKTYQCFHKKKYSAFCINFMDTRIQIVGTNRIWANMPV